MLKCKNSKKGTCSLLTLLPFPDTEFVDFQYSLTSKNHFLLPLFYHFHISISSRFIKKWAPLIQLESEKSGHAAKPWLKTYFYTDIIKGGKMYKNHLIPLILVLSLLNECIFNFIYLHFISNLHKSTLSGKFLAPNGARPVCTPYCYATVYCAFYFPPRFALCVQLQSIDIVQYSVD